MKSASSGYIGFYSAIIGLLLTTAYACSGTKSSTTETSSGKREATYRSTSASSEKKKVVVTPTTPVVNANLAPGLERDVLALVNEYRQTKKLPPLQPNSAIEYQARRHSMDMATHRIPFGHQGLSFRMKYIYEKVPGTSQVGENVAFGNLSAKAVVSGWLKSPTHKKNIESNYKFTGIGVSRNMQNQIYFTQLFAK
jgi:uncharacterized protein YkwD